MSTTKIAVRSLERKTIVFEATPSVLWINPGGYDITSNSASYGNRLFNRKEKSVAVSFTESPADVLMNITPVMEITVDGITYPNVGLIEFIDEDIVIFYGPDSEDLVYTFKLELSKQYGRFAAEKFKNRSLERKNEKLEKENKDLRNRLAEESGAEKGFQDEIKKLKDALYLQNIHLAVENLKKSIEQMTTEKDKLETEKYTKDHEKQHLQSNIQQLIDENIKLTNEIQKLKENTWNMTASIENAKEEKEKLEADYTALSDKYATNYAPPVLDNLRTKIENLKDDLNKAREEFYRLEGEKEVYQSLLDDRNCENKNV